METYRISLNHGWRFALTDEERAVMPDYDERDFAAVTLPHDWQIEQTRRPDAPGGGSQGFFPREHRGVYRLHLHAPQEWAGKRVRLLFDGVQRFSDVYANGARVGGSKFGYTPFVCDVTDALTIGGDNVIAVSADNRMPEGKRWMAAGSDRWYSGAGIYRHVWLLVDDAVRIAHDGVRVVAEPVIAGPSGDVPDVAGISCREARVRIAVEVEGGCGGRRVLGEITGPDGAVIWRGEADAQAVTRFELRIEKPSLWSPESPALYTLDVSLDGKQAHRVRFGVRSAVFDDEEGFLLNGEKRKLWGVNLHHDGGAVGAAVPIEIWRRRLQSLRRMGVNTIRASHNPMAEEVYDLCDEMGFLVVDELCDKWSGNNMYTDAIYDEEHERMLTAMIRRDANHPCVTLWSVGNEIGHQYSELFFACLEELCALTRKLDPTRAVTAALIGFVLPQYNDRTPLGRRFDAVRRYAAIVDVMSMNYMEHFYERMREAGIRRPIIGSEVRTYYRLDEKIMNNAQVSDESPYAIVRKYDWVCGALVWAGCDYLGESSGWPWRGWTGNPLDSTADWKPRAWYVASQFKAEPVLRLHVYDESEPWDGARGMWGFPQMRSHWKYSQFEKMLHVCAMTNCDTVKLYQNSQSVRVGHPSPDGMVHFVLPFIPGVLRAEGYIGSVKVCEDKLTSDHEADSVRVICDRERMPADGQSVAMIDVLIEDKHGRRYVLEDRPVTVNASGAPVTILMDSGDAADTQGFARTACRTHNGHMLILAKAGLQAGEVGLGIEIEGLGVHSVTLRLEKAE